MVHVEGREDSKTVRSLTRAVVQSKCSRVMRSTRMFNELPTMRSTRMFNELPSYAGNSQAAVEGRPARSRGRAGCVNKGSFILLLDGHVFDARHCPDRWQHRHEKTHAGCYPRVSRHECTAVQSLACNRLVNVLLTKAGRHKTSANTIPVLVRSFHFSFRKPRDGARDPKLINRGNKSISWRRL